MKPSRSIRRSKGSEASNQWGLCVMFGFIKEFNDRINDKIRSLSAESIDDAERRKKRTFEVTVAPIGNAIYVNGEMAGNFDYCGSINIFIGVPYHVRRVIHQSDDVHRESRRIRLDVERRIRDRENRKQKAWSILEEQG